MLHVFFKGPVGLLVFTFLLHYPTIKAEQTEQNVDFTCRLE